MTQPKKPSSVKRWLQEKMKHGDSAVTKALTTIDRVRPYAHRAVKFGLPAGFLTNVMISSSKKAPGWLKGVGITGATAAMAGVGVADKYLENLSRDRKFKKYLKEYRKSI
jgi:hypothetical protein